MVQEEAGVRETRSVRGGWSTEGAGREGPIRRPSVVATRFVRACPRGHVDDLDWRRFVHGPEDELPAAALAGRARYRRRPGGPRCALRVRQSSEPATSDAEIEINPLGTCRGARPWLGRNTKESCDLPSRLLIRTASNAYFPAGRQRAVAARSRSAVEKAVAELWDDLQIVDDAGDLAFSREAEGSPAARTLTDDEEVLEAIRSARAADRSERPVKQVELDALLAAPEGFGDDVPVDPNFHARRLPDMAWRRSK